MEDSYTDRVLDLANGSNVSESKEKRPQIPSSRVVALAVKILKIAQK